MQISGVCMCVCVYTCCWLSFSGETWTDTIPCCCCSVAKLCLTLCDSKDCSTPGFPISRSLLKLMSMELMRPSHHLILCFHIFPFSLPRSDGTEPLKAGLLEKI